MESVPSLEQGYLRGERVTQQSKEARWAWSHSCSGCIWCKTSLGILNECSLAWAYSSLCGSSEYAPRDLWSRSTHISYHGCCDSCSRYHLRSLSSPANYNLVAINSGHSLKTNKSHCIRTIPRLRPPPQSYDLVLYSGCPGRSCLAPIYARLNDQRISWTCCRLTWKTWGYL